ncbi:MAG: sensor histidine kinase [Bacteroidia bacterium]|nr:sensor histidine kinase [Bacteroidia bacterium]
MKLTTVLSIPLFLLLFSISGFSQNPEVVDSLQKLIARTKIDTVKVEALNALAWQYRSNDSTKAFAYLRQAEELALACKDQLGYCLALNERGVVFKNHYKLDEAEACYKKAFQIAQTENSNQMMASVLNNMATLKRIRNNLKGAINDYYQALKRYQAESNYYGMGATYNNIAEVFSMMDQTEESRKYLLKTIGISNKIDKEDNFIIAIAYNNLGFMAYYQDRFKESIEYYEKALAIYRSNRDSNGIADMLIKVGNSLVESGQLQKGKAMIEEGGKIASTQDFSIVVILGKESLAQAFWKEKNYKKAIALLEETIQLSKKFNQRNPIMESYEMLSLIYAEMGDYKSGFELQKQFSALKDSILSADNRSTLAEMEVKYQTEKKELENVKLKEQTATQELKLVQKNGVIAVVFGLLIILALVFSLVYIRNKSKQKSIMDAEILKLQEQKNRAIIEAEEKERIRIAKDLHDGVGQMVSALKLQLSSLETGVNFKSQEEQERFTGMIGLVDETVKEVRSVSHSMMPNALIRSGLNSAVREFVQRISSTDKLKVDLEIVGLNERLEQTTETILFRVLQEIVSNIVKHAEANHVTIQLIRHDNEITLMVEDNGKGFDTSKIQDFEGIGLRNLYSRVEFLQGSIHFDSSLGRGTTVTVDIPLK